MSEIYLKRLREFASMDFIPSIIRCIEEENKDIPGNSKVIEKLKDIIYGDVSNISQGYEELCFICKHLDFQLRFSLILMEIEAYYELESTFLLFKRVSIQIEDRLSINGVFETLRTLPDYYYNTLIKSIDNSEYYQEELIDCVVQNNKKEFVEIIRRERYDIALLTNICSFYNRTMTNIGMIISGDFANMTEEDLKKIEIKDTHCFLALLGDEATKQHQDDTSDFSELITQALIYSYWTNKNKRTTTEKNILEGVIDEIRNSPLYIDLYNQFHKDGIFYPDGVEGTDIEEAEVEEVITNSLPESPKEPINTSKKYEGDVPLYCQNKDRSGKKPLKLDEYYTNDRNRVMTLLKTLAENEFIWEGEINSFYTHFTGFGDSDKVSKKLHWRKGNVRDLAFFIFLMYPYECNDTVRYDPIKEHIEYKHESSSYDNGTNFTSAATRPTPEFKELLCKLYCKENKRPIRYDKM